MLKRKSCLSSSQALSGQLDPIKDASSLCPCDLFGGWGGVRDKVSLCSPGCPGTHSVEQAGLELGNLAASASQSAGIIGRQRQADF